MHIQPIPTYCSHESSEGGGERGHALFLRRKCDISDVVCKRNSEAGGISLQVPV